MSMHRFVVLMAALCCVMSVSMSADSDRWKEGAPLLRPAPTDRSPFLPKAEEAARKKYPELFEGKFTGSVGIYVDLDIDDHILSMSTIQFPAGPVTERSGTKAERDAMWQTTFHNAFLRPGALGQKFIGWYGSKRNNGLYLNYRVLKWPVDAARSVDKVRAAVASRYPDYFKPRPLSTTHDSSESVLTVVMDEGGKIAGAKLIENAGLEELSDRRMFDRFLELGLKPEQLAHRGRTSNRGDWQDKNLSAPLLFIEFAWRRMNDDPPDEVLQSLDVFEQVSLLHLQEQTAAAPDEEFVKRYFSNVWRNGLPNGVEGVWILFSREGHVLDTGTTAESDMRAVEEQLQKRYRGITANEGGSSGVKTQAGSTINFYYVWIAADSPVTLKPREIAND